MNSRVLVLLALLSLLAVPQAGNAQTAGLLPPQPLPCPFEILFSISPPENFGFAWPPFKDGDVASDHGYVLARNAQLVSKFGPPQTLDAAGNLVAVDYGLDALFELRCYPAPTTFRPAILFSVKKGFHSSTLNVDISDGDLLSDAGKIVATNAQLMANFHPMPAVDNVGLDAVFIPYYLPTAANLLPPEIWFSTNKGWFDEKLGHYISDGDLLSSRGYVVATNQQLLRNWLIFPMIVTDPTQPPLINMGLDAAYVPCFRPWAVDALTSAQPQVPEIWFSVNKGFTDKFGRQISDGDLLSTSGRIVRTNSQLLEKFPNLTMGPVLLNYGLDAAFVRGRKLIAIYPPGPTVPKTTGNVVRLVFDGSVTLPDSTPLSVAGPAIPQGSAGALDMASTTFAVSVDTTNTAGDTLVLTECGAALGSAAPYTIQPSDALDVEPFALNVAKLVGDICSDGAVNVGDLQQLVATWGRSQTDGGFNTLGDLNNDGSVNIGDLQLLVANWGRGL